MQILHGDSLHEMSNPAFWKKKKDKYHQLSSAELAQRVVMVKEGYLMVILPYFLLFLHKNIRSDYSLGVCIYGELLLKIIPELSTKCPPKQIPLIVCSVWGIHVTK